MSTGQYRVTPVTLGDGKVELLLIDAAGRVVTTMGGSTGLMGAITTAAAALVLNTLGLSRFNSTKPSLLDTQLTEFQATARGALLIANDEPSPYDDTTNRVAATRERPFVDTNYGWLLYRSTALEASAIAKNAPGMITGLDVRVDSTLASGTYYVQVLNSATVPVDGAVTHIVAPYKVIHTIGYDDNIEDRFQAIFASAGIVICLSTTEFTKTLGGTNLSIGKVLGA